MADPALELDYGTQAALAAARSKASNTYGQARATNDYQRSSLDARFNQNQAQMGLQWDRQRGKLPGGYARRGLLNSGVYHQGLQDYAVNRGNAYNQALQQYGEQAGAIGLQGQSTEQTYADAMATIAAQEQMARSQVASTLRGLL
jgi:hypothetical protein